MCSNPPASQGQQSRQRESEQQIERARLAQQRGVQALYTIQRDRKTESTERERQGQHELVSTNQLTQFFVLLDKEGNNNNNCKRFDKLITL